MWFCLRRSLKRAKKDFNKGSPSDSREFAVHALKTLLSYQALNESFMHRFNSCAAALLIKYRKPKYRFAFTTTKNNVEKDVRKLTQQKEEHSSKYFKNLTREKTNSILRGHHLASPPFARGK